jgi:hypothetical protein
MTYSFPYYIPLAAALVSIVAGFGAFLLFRKRGLRPFGIIALFICIMAGPMLAPMLALDRVALTDEKLEQTTGFWFSPTVKGFKLKGISSMTIEVAKGSKNLKHQVWTAEYVDGRRKVIDPGDLWEIHSEDIIRRLRDKGIAVHGP